MKIKDIPLENRPRERLLKHGAGVLSDSELLAVILQKGTSKDNAVDAQKYAVSGIAKPAVSAICPISCFQNIP